MTRILISGYYGFNNIGDESILKAVVDALKKEIPEALITVLSKTPLLTSEKFKVKSVDRKSPFKVLKALNKTDLLISGGGSLLQDVTSKRSILYYLMIMWGAMFFRKPVFIYSQGIGPIKTGINRRLTACTLKKAKGIVVRDELSKDFLIEIGLKEDRIKVAADPVLRIPRVDLQEGLKILRTEGFVREAGKTVIGFAIKERDITSPFVDQLELAVKTLSLEKNCQIVLIPFHFDEDVAVINELKHRLGPLVYTIDNKYLTEEMLSIIGNMDLLAGVRLHSLIHAAIMGVKMIGISYDPKVNRFLSSIGLKAHSSTIDFHNEFFVEEVESLLKPSYEEVQEKVSKKVEKLVESLSVNEALIIEILEKSKGS